MMNKFPVLIKIFSLISILRDFPFHHIYYLWVGFVKKKLQVQLLNPCMYSLGGQVACCMFNEKVSE